MKRTHPVNTAFWWDDFGLQGKARNSYMQVL